MLMTCNCTKCKVQIGIVQYTDHYFCKKDYGEYVCIDCYKIGQKKCIKCNQNLIFHNSDETKKFQRDNNILF